MKALSAISNAYRNAGIKVAVMAATAAMANTASAQDANDVIQKGDDLMQTLISAAGTFAQLMGTIIAIKLITKMIQGERDGDKPADTVKKWVAAAALMALPEFMDVGVSTFF